jgi:hypothetical protein
MGFTMRNQGRAHAASRLPCPIYVSPHERYAGKRSEFRGSIQTLEEHSLCGRAAVNWAEMACM